MLIINEVEDSAAFYGIAYMYVKEKVLRRLEGEWEVGHLCLITLGLRKWENCRNTVTGILPSQAPLFPIPAFFSQHRVHL